MKFIHSFILLFAGAVFGVAMVLSCGDDARHSDAATCDCPASEPPIAGRIVVSESMATIDAGTQGGAGTSCSPGMVFLSGSCSGDNLQTTEDITLQVAAFNNMDPGGWLCVYKNNTSSPVRVKASIRCLKPGT